MGGKVFTTAAADRPALTTPRMPSSVYHLLKERMTGLLRQLFDLVDTPVEAPGKVDYGDVDFVVSKPKIDILRSIWEGVRPSDRSATSYEDSPDQRAAVLRHHLSAAYHVAGARPCTTHFAVPYPEQENYFVQIDVNEQPQHLHTWAVFQESYGDFWNLIGTSIRPYGIVLTDEGMFIMNPTIEKFNKKQSRTMLTTRPSEALEFLGLDREQWESGWRTEYEMFDYVSNSRLFSPRSFLKISEFNSNDRKRLGKRPCFTRFVNLYVPSLIEAACISKEDALAGNTKSTEEWPDATNLRELIIVEALDKFGVRAEYEENNRKWEESRLAMEQKRQARADRRIENKRANRGYSQHWIDWFLENQLEDQRRALDLDMDKESAEWSKKHDSQLESSRALPNGKIEG